LNGFFRPIPQKRRVEWGSESAPYEGWLKVNPLRPGSELVVHVRMPASGEHTQGTLENLLNTIRRLIEEEGGEEGARQGLA
jgi:hypothetical protein